MYPHPHTLNPIHVSEGGHEIVSAWGQEFNYAKTHAMIHRTVNIVHYLDRINVQWPPRDGVQRNPHTPKTTLPRITYGYAGPVLLGPADEKLYG